MQYRPLGATGLEVSVLGLGGAQFGQQYGPLGVDQCRDVLGAALDAGINLIDTSAYYGQGKSEEILGELLTATQRSKIVLASKAGRLGRAEFDFTAVGLTRSVENSLRRLRTDHLDILLAHDIEFAADPVLIFGETIPALHALKAQGKARFIGVSCLPLELLREAVQRGGLDVVLTYCHFHLQDQSLPASGLLEAATAHDTGVLNASPLGMGLLTNAGPPPWHPGSGKLKAAARAAAESAALHGTDISHLAMQFALQCAPAGVASTITGASTVAELQRNLLALTEPLPERALASVQTIFAPVLNDGW